MEVGIDILYGDSGQYSGWVKSFSKHLKGYMLKVESMNANVNVVSSLNGLDKKNTLIVVLDNKASENSELQGFSGYDDNNNVFVVMPGHMSTEVPGKLLFHNRYDFYVYDSADDGYHTAASDNKMSRVYWAKLFDLSQDIAVNYLAHNDSAISIFVAETNADQQVSRDELIRDLKNSGYKVYPNKPLPTNLAEKEKLVEEIASKVNVSIHIIGAEHLNFKEVAVENRICSKHSESRAGSKSPLHRYIWTVPDLRIGEDEKVSVESLKSDPAMIHGAELVEAPIEVLKTLVYSKLKEVQLSSEDEDHSYENCIYVINEPKYADRAEELKTLLSSKGIKTVASSFDEMDLDLLNRHKRILKECAGCVILDPENNGMWIKSKVDDIIKSPGYGRTKGFSGICLVSKQNEGGLLENFNNYRFVDISNGISNEALNPFIELVN